MMTANTEQQNALEKFGTGTPEFISKNPEFALELQYFFKTCRDLLAFTGNDGQIMRINPSWETITGWTAEELHSKLFIDFIHPDDRPEMSRLFSDSKPSDNQRNSHQQFEGRFLCKNNHYIMLHWSITRHDERKVIYAIARDITVEKRHQLKQLHRQKNRAIQALATGIAHDFNNILGAMIGYTELIKMDMPADSLQMDNLNQILRATNRARELIDRLKLISKKGPVEAAPMDLCVIVREVIGLLKVSTPETIDIQLEINRETAFVLANSIQMHRVVMNICKNAVQAMESRGGTLRIALMHKDCESPKHKNGQIGNTSDGCYQLSISDNGIGMDDETLKHIFDPYFTTKPIERGQGMGLAIVKGIVNSFSGKINVSSFPGRGSTFDLSFPALKYTPKTQQLNNE